MKWFFVILSLCTGCLLLVTGCSTDENNKKEPPAATTVNNVQKDSIPAKPVVIKEKNTGDKILDSLLQLPFIIAANKHIDSFSHHKNGIAFIIDSSEKEWMIQAGYNGDNRFETYHRLYANPATFDIKVYDVVNDEKLSVAEYLKKEEQ